MTAHERIEPRVRARMGETGEAYLVARSRVLNQTPPDLYRLRGGVHPETAALAGVFANRGIVDPSRGVALSEAMILGIGGGLGAGKVSWEFDGGERRTVTTGFRIHSEDPARWLRMACERLGMPVEVNRTSEPYQAREHLVSTLDDGRPAVTLVSAADLPYWHMTAGDSAPCYAITVYGVIDGAVLIDDRNRAQLTVTHDDLSSARASIPTLQNAVVVPDAAACEVDAATLATAIGAGLAEHVEHLGDTSRLSSLAAFRDWARLVADDHDPAGWPNAFADGRGMLRALMATYEALTEVGITGGNLRNLYADFLVEAAVMTGLPLRNAAAAYRTAADAWLRCAAVCASVPVVRRIVVAEARRRSAVALGDRGAADAAEAAGERADLMATDDVGLRRDDRTSLLLDLSAALARAYDAEVTALEALRTARP